MARKVCFVLLLMASGCLVGSPALGTELQVRRGHLPRAVHGLQPLRSLESNRRLDLAIGLPLRNREALARLLTQLYDSGSPEYRRFLTPEQFTEKFGPEEKDYQAVIDFAKSNHFVIAGTHRNRILLDVNAAATDIESAFKVKLKVYQHPSERRTFYAPDTEPSLDAKIPVLSVSGLDDFWVAKPMDFHSRFRPASSRLPKINSSSQPALDATGSGPSGNFIGLDFRRAYVPGVSLTGTGQSIGLLELDSYYPEDISAYEDLAGLPAVPLINVLVNGFNRAPGANNGEVALDIQMAISMAPGLASVFVYEGSLANDVLNRMATDNAARQISSSWSFGHAVDATREQIFLQFAAQGQSFFQASGDSGAYGPLFPPADDPWVTAVGGTALVTTDPLGAWANETTWFGSGGGVSPNYPIPSWQQSLANSTNLGSTTMRNVPDVAAQADATIWVIANNGEQGTVGGTSAAAPLWAGFAALVNQQAVLLGQPSLGFLNPALYAVGRSAVGAYAFHDITVGSNANSASPNRFFAAPGFDLCTGWGTPNGTNLVNALLAPPDALRLVGNSNLVFSGVAGGPFLPATLNLSLSNSGPSSLSWAAAVGAPWLSVLPATGILNSNRAATPVTVQLTPAAMALSSGSYVASVWFTNLSDGFPQARTVVLNVNSLPTFTLQPMNQTVPAGADVSFTVQLATNALLAFQWNSNSVNLVDGPEISGSQTARLTLSSVKAANNASYSVTVTNVAGAVTSSAALLTVTASPPIIVSQPVSQTVLPTAAATFAVMAYGDAPLSYFWQRFGTNLVDGGNISGSQTPTLKLAQVNLGDAGTYSVLVTNALGFAQSAGAILQSVTLTTPELRQETVHAFNGLTDGAHPNSLSSGNGGVLYGSTQSGGPQNGGTLFSLRSNQLQTLYAFKGTNDGRRPNGDLLQLSSGALLGSTFGGGTNGFGTLFRLETNNTLTTVFTLDHVYGVLPMAGLIQSADGSFWGTAYEGGIFHYGTVYKLDGPGTFSVQVPFDSTNAAFSASRLVTGSDGRFYGTSYKGGATGKGTVFAVTPDGEFSSLVSFDGTNGAFPVASVTEALDGSFYGATTAGGTMGMGNLFHMTSDGRVTNVYSFSGQNDGSRPSAAPLLSRDGNFYGVTRDGGLFGFGTVYRLSPVGLLNTIAQFDGLNGANPEAVLVEAVDGSLYGSTQNGGPSNAGVVFRLSVPASAPQITAAPADATVYAGATVKFSVASFGTAPIYYRWQKEGTDLSDTTRVSGSQSRVVTIQNVDVADAGIYSVVVSNQFGAVRTSAAKLQVLVSPPVVLSPPTNQMVQPGSKVTFRAVVVGNLPMSFQWLLNGTTLANSGNVSGTQSATLVLTNVTEANNGTYTLVSSNALGTVQTSAATLLVVPPSAPGTVVNTVYSFSGGSDGSRPNKLLDGTDGWFYGTTALGGAFGLGTIFKLDAKGGLVTLDSFDQTNGASPHSGLTRASGGLYGTTSAGGAGNSGTVFSVSPSGQLVTTHAFSGGADGRAPLSELMTGADGGLYAGTTLGGQNSLGTLFELSPQGVVTNLYSFKGGPDGARPGPLLLGPNGEFFGLTPAGGTFTKGNCFRWIPGQAPVTIYSFTGGTDGSVPVGGLVLGDDGTLYGATRYNTIRGLMFNGTLFKLTTNGTLTTLYSLNFTDGSYPAAGLVLGNDGNFYGTTETGGPNDYGTVFRMTPSGVFSTLLEFDGFDDGANPQTVLITGTDGNLYGTTSSGGPGGGGTIFRLTFTGPPTVTTQPFNQLGYTGGSAWFSVAVSGASPMSYRWQKDGVDLVDSPDIVGSASRVLRLTNLSANQAGSYSVLVTNGLGLVQSAGATLTIQAGPPFVRATLQDNATLVLSWSTAPNRAYQVQSTASLEPANWVAVGSHITSTSAQLSVQVSGASSAHLFYRVVLLP